MIFIIFIIINKMKQQITENKENLFFEIKNCADVSSDLKKETPKYYSGVAWRHSNQRFRRCDLKQMLIDNGHRGITTVHFEPLRSSIFTIKPITQVNFRVILNTL